MRTGSDSPLNIMDTRTGRNSTRTSEIHVHRKIKQCWVLYREITIFCKMSCEPDYQTVILTCHYAIPIVVYSAIGCCVFSSTPLHAITIRDAILVNL